MKSIILSVALLFSALICNAQIAAPIQTDTLIISSVKYNYADINKENWPCDIIYKSTKDIRIGEQTFNIVNAGKFMGIVCFSVYDIDDANKKEYDLNFKEDENGEYVLSFSGYEFGGYKKGSKIEALNEEIIEDIPIFNSPSVKFYQLNGRKASNLPIPAYRCNSDGEVTVIISVNPAGQVVKAEVKDDVSSSDECLRSFALRAARLSRFSANADAKANEIGEIIYSFGEPEDEQISAEPNAKLAGRSVNGTLPRPTSASKATGIVVVQVWVDNYGNVQKAVAGVEGTTITDKTLWQSARKAALGAHFNMNADAPALQEGTITYQFK